jgi:hypothetical protein
VHRLVWTVSAVILIAIVPACSRNASRSGTLTGRALLYGGPATASGKQALNGEPGQDIIVSVVGVDGRTIASSTTRTDGKFTFQLPPGRYTVTGCATTTVQIAAGKATVHDLTCPVP